MAEQTAHDVVKEAQSVGDFSPIDVPAKPSNIAPAGNGKAHPTHDNFDAQQDLAADGPAGSVRPEAVAVTDAQGPEEANVAEPTDVPMDESEIQAVVADASGGSDTDTSKDAKGIAAGHGRSNSVKKPTSFKSVSVTKNFLAKTVTAPAPKVGDKGKHYLPRSHRALQWLTRPSIARYTNDRVPSCSPAKRSAAPCRKVDFGRSDQDCENERCGAGRQQSVE